MESPHAIRDVRIGTARTRPVSLWRTPRTRALLLLGSVGAVIAPLWLTAQLFTELLWFRELGHPEAYWTTLEWKLLARGVVPLGTVTALLATFAVSDVVMARHPHVRIARGVAVVRPQRWLVYSLVALAGGIVSSLRWPDDGWQHLLLWAHRTEFGVTDPLFGRDVGFFVFSLPVYREVTAWVLDTLVMVCVATVAAYALAGGLRLRRPRSIVPGAGSHLLGIASVLLLVVAWRFRLEQLELALPRERTALVGASYVGVHVRLPALQLLSGLALAGAALCATSIVRRASPRLVVYIIALGALALFGAQSLPSLVQHYQVDPQELTRERPYIHRAIAATRRAYALDDVTLVSLDAGSTVSAADVANDRTTIENVPLWDGGVVRAAMNELETIGSYYDFGQTTIAPYTIDGTRRVMTIAAREVDLRRLGRDARGWANERFAYTHGYGVTGIGAGSVDAERFPIFDQREFASGANPLGVRQPRIYFGERRPSDPPYVVVPSKRGEVEKPIPGSRAATYHYDGPGGIPLTTLARRAAFAARFGDLKLLLSRTVTDRSRIILHRDVRRRVLALAPFLRWDARPTVAVVDGRITYLFHGYTTSDSYPYSARVVFMRARVNYLRQAALAAVDAFSGRVDIYAADDADPIMRAWQAAYPRLFLSPSGMPRALRAQLRYPRALFAKQIEVYATYHAADTTAFWTGADAWERPLQIAGPIERAGELHFPKPEQSIDPDERRENGVTSESFRMRPAYLLARLPGDEEQRFVLASAFTPRGRHNLVAYVAGWVDAHGRLRLTTLSLPRDRLTQGPAQATRRILASEDVSRRLELLNRETRDLGKTAVQRTVLGVPRVLPLARAARDDPAGLHDRRGRRRAAARARHRVRQRPRRVRRLRRGGSQAGARARSERASVRTSARSAIRTSIARATNTTATTIRVTPSGSRNCTVKSSSISVASPRLRRSLIRAATAYSATPAVRSSSMRSRPARGSGPVPAPIA